jgi:flagellin-like protein
MKGITPIISTIILLLIAIGLAGTAYVYISSYVTPLTAKDFTIVPGSESCVASTSTNTGNVSVRVINTGSTTLATADLTTRQINDNTAAAITFSVLSGQSGSISLNCTNSTGTAPCPAGNIHTIKVGTVSGVKSARVTC